MRVQLKNYTFDKSQWEKLFANQKAHSVEKLPKKEVPLPGRLRKIW